MKLEIRELGVDVDGRRVLAGITLDVAPGEVIAVAGPNGAGKSTMLRALAGVGMQAGVVRHGEVRVDGQPIEAMQPRARGRALAYLPQDRTVHWPLAASRVVALGRLPHGTGGSESAEDRRAVDAALAAMDVAALRSRPVSHLSGGERARVLVARALAQEAALLVADEPTAGLDPAHALDLFHHFGRLAADGRSVVVALHDLTLARRFCHRMVLLKDGAAYAIGPPAEVLTAESLAAVYGVSAAIGEIDGVPVIVAREPLTAPQ